MTTAEAALRQEILRSNHALRDWASGLRQRGETARAAAGEQRARARSFVRSSARAEYEPVSRPAGRRAARPALEPEAPDETMRLPSLGAVPVSDLFVILVDHHGFGVLDAISALVSGLSSAGYPPDFESVSAPDAMDILHDALRDRSS